MYLMYHAGMRAVTLADAKTLANLEFELFEEHLNADALRTEIKAGFGWLIEDSANLRSYILVRDDGHILDITRFGTRTEHQGQGLGTELLCHVLRTLRPVMLTVTEENTVALRMYFKHGFHVVGRLPHEQSWVLRRD